MNLTLKRKVFTNESTTGELFINDVFECYTLEDTDRGLTATMDIKDIEKTKIHSKTAIPYGEYEVVITFSNRFKCLMPLLVNVKGYAGVRIHTGNKAADTEGCILVGKTVGLDFVGNSRAEYAELFAKLSEAAAKEKIILTIIKS